MPALNRTYAALQRARTIVHYLFHDQVCAHCKQPFSEDDIRDFRVTMNHKDENRRNNSRKNQEWMHHKCHLSFTMKQRQKELHACKRLVRLGLKKPGKTKQVKRATKYGG